MKQASETGKCVGTITIKENGPITYTGEFFDRLRKPPITDERLREVAGQIVDCYAQAPNASEGLEELDLDKAVAILRKLVEEARQ